MHTSREGAPAAPLLLTLALLATTGPLFSDMYLPGFPRIADEFGVGPTEVQLTLTAGLAGVALGQIVLGPASDRLGRRGPLLGGIVLAVIASVVSALAPSLPMLIAARFVQGLGVAAGLVISRAIVSDRTAGLQTIRWLSRIAVFTGIGALLAPAAGGLMASTWGWRAALWVLTGYLVVLLALVVRLVPESHPPARRRAMRGERAGLSAAFFAYALTLAFGFGAYTAFVSASPFIYQGMIGWSTTQFGFVFAGHALVMAASSLLSARLAARVPVQRLLGFSIACILAAGVGALVIAVTGAPAIAYPFALFPVSIGVGFLLPTSMTLALGEARRSAGLGSAVLGFLQFAVASGLAPLVSLGPSPLLAFGAVLGGAGLLAALSFAAVAWIRRARASAP